MHIDCFISYVYMYYFAGWQYHPTFCCWCFLVKCEKVYRFMPDIVEVLMRSTVSICPQVGARCYPWYLGITRRSCLEAHMVLDMEYREQEWLEHGPRGPIFLLLSRLCPVSSTSLHHYRPGLASEKALAPWGNRSEVSWYVSCLIIITFGYMHQIPFISDNCLDLTLTHLTIVGGINGVP